MSGSFLDALEVVEEEELQSVTQKIEKEPRKRRKPAKKKKTEDVTILPPKVFDIDLDDDEVFSEVAMILEGVARLARRMGKTKIRPDDVSTVLLAAYPYLADRKTFMKAVEKKVLVTDSHKWRFSVPP